MIYKRRASLHVRFFVQFLSHFLSHFFNATFVTLEAAIVLQIGGTFAAVN